MPRTHRVRSARPALMVQTLLEMASTCKSPPWSGSHAQARGFIASHHPMHRQPRCTRPFDAPNATGKPNRGSDESPKNHSGAESRLRRESAEPLGCQSRLRQKSAEPLGCRVEAPTRVRRATRVPSRGSDESPKANPDAEPEPEGWLACRLTCQVGDRTEVGTATDVASGSSYGNTTVR
jgi:hypothetical protein